MTFSKGIQVVYAIFVLHFLAGCDDRRTDALPSPSFLEIRKTFQTKLLQVGPSPQEYENEQPPTGVEEIFYQSDGRLLKAWLCKPQGGIVKGARVVVFFHGGVSFSRSDFESCAPFLEKNFVILAPMLRGENGNPGDFELCLGEIDDARAAIRWIANQPFVDPKRIYTFGHSAGGIVSAMVSLYDDVPVRLTGSTGGLYGPRFFQAYSFVPFDPRDTTECRMRSLIGNVRDMRIPHLAFVGNEDTFQEVVAARAEAKTSLLKIEIVAGGHHTAVPESMRLFIDAIDKLEAHP